MTMLVSHFRTPTTPAIVAFTTAPALGTRSVASVIIAWSTTSTLGSFVSARYAAANVVSPALYSVSLTRIAWTRMRGLGSLSAPRTSGASSAPPPNPSSVQSA